MQFQWNMSEKEYQSCYVKAVKWGTAAKTLFAAASAWALANAMFWLGTHRYWHGSPSIRYLALGGILASGVVLLLAWGYGAGLWAGILLAARSRILGGREVSVSLSAQELLAVQEFQKGPRQRAWDISRVRCVRDLGEVWRIEIGGRRLILGKDFLTEGTGEEFLHFLTGQGIPVFEGRGKVQVNLSRNGLFAPEENGS